MRFLFPIVIFFCGAFVHPPVITEDQRFKTIVRHESDIIANELNISPFGFGVEGPKGIQGITLSYSSNQRVNLHQARRLIIRLAQNVTSRVNNRISTEHLNRSPVDLSFFYFSIGFDGINTLYNENEGEIAFVVISKGIVHYKISRPESKRFIPIHSEPYDEAYRIVFGDQ